MKTENGNAQPENNAQPQQAATQQTVINPELAAMMAVSGGIAEKVAAEFDGLTVNVNHSTDWETAAKIGAGIAAGIAVGALVAVGVSYLMPSKGESTKELLSLF